MIQPSSLNSQTTTGANGFAPRLEGALPRTDAAGALRSRQLSFSELLGRHSGSHDPGLSPEEKARAAAEQFVSVAFIQPMLKQVRESSWAAAPFAPNSAEKQFRALQDAALAQQIVHSCKFPLVERVARDVLSAVAGEKEGGALLDATSARQEAR